MRTVPAILTAATLALLGAAPAQADDPTFEASLTPERIAFGDGTEPEARLTIQTGADAETFNVSTDATSPEFIDLDGRSAGGGVLGVGCARPRVEGPGTLGPLRCTVPSLPACNRTGLRVFHGIFDGSGDLEVSVPPRSRTTLVFRARQSMDAPWPASRFQVRFQVSDGTLAGPQAIETPRLAPAGRTGVRIGLRVEPAGGGFCEPAPQVRGPLTVRGRTDPSLAGQEILLRTATTDEQVPRDLARVRVADDGTFAFAGWRPPPGYREVAATYAAQRPELADDFSAPVAFELTGNDPDRDPVTEPRPDDGPPKGTPPGSDDGGSPAADPLRPEPRIFLANRGLRADRTGLVRLRLLCPSSVEGACRPGISLRARGRTLATRRPVTLLPGRPRTIRVRLSRSARRLLARERRLRVGVRIGDQPAVSSTLRRRR